MFMQTYETFNFNELMNTYNEEKVLTKFIKNILKDGCSSNTVFSHFHHIFVLAIDHCSFFFYYFFLILFFFYFAFFVVAFFVGGICIYLQVLSKQNNGISLYLQNSNNILHVRVCIYKQWSSNLFHDFSEGTGQTYILRIFL